MFSFCKKKLQRKIVPSLLFWFQKPGGTLLAKLLPGYYR